MQNPSLKFRKTLILNRLYALRSQLCSSPCEEDEASLLIHPLSTHRARRANLPSVVSRPLGSSRSRSSTRLLSLSPSRIPTAEPQHVQSRRMIKAGATPVASSPVHSILLTSPRAVPNPARRRRDRPTTQDNLARRGGRIRFPGAGAGPRLISGPGSPPKCTVQQQQHSTKETGPKPTLRGGGTQQSLPERIFQLVRAFSRESVQTPHTTGAGGLAVPQTAAGRRLREARASADSVKVVVPRVIIRGKDTKKEREKETETEKAKAKAKKNEKEKEKTHGQGRVDVAINTDDAMFPYQDDVDSDGEGYNDNAKGEY